MKYDLFECKKHIKNNHNSAANFREILNRLFDSTENLIFKVFHFHSQLCRICWLADWLSEKLSICSIGIEQF